MIKALTVSLLVFAFAQNASPKPVYHPYRHRPTVPLKSDRRERGSRDSKPTDGVPATFSLICQYDEPSNEKVVLTVRAGTEVVEDCPLQVLQTLAPMIGRIFSLGEYGDRFCRYASVLSRDSNEQIAPVDGTVQLPAIKVSNGIVTCPKN